MLCCNVIGKRMAKIQFCNNDQVGWQIGDTPTIRSLLYGTILPSGADAAQALAIYTAGSEEAFVELMNKKLAELGISDTAHFTNAVGAYDEDHYCTALDMATILRAAIDNELCREVLSCHYYEVPPSGGEESQAIGGNCPPLLSFMLVAISLRIFPSVSIPKLMVEGRFGNALRSNFL